MSKSSRLSSICQKLLTDCLTPIESEPDWIHDEEFVHELRVATKRLRAAWKIGGAVAGEAFIKERAAVLRKLSALLAGDRDLAVLANLCHTLNERHSEPAFEEVIQHLEGRFSHRHPPGFADQLTSMIRGEIEAWQQVVFESEAAETRAHRTAIKKSHRAAITATREAISSHDPEVWHDWRKRIKRLRYQREFLAEIQNRRPGIRDQRISRLGSRLGDRNDFANLTQVIVDLGNEPSLRKIVAQEERAIIGNCRRLGRRNLLAR